MSGNGINDAGQPARHLFGTQHIIEHDLQWPRLQQIGSALSDNRNEGPQREFSNVAEADS
jgi:hypothetical protein